MVDEITKKKAQTNFQVLHWYIELKNSYWKDILQ